MMLGSVTKYNCSTDQLQCHTLSASKGLADKDRSQSFLNIPDRVGDCVTCKHQPYTRQKCFGLFIFRGGG